MRFGGWLFIDKSDLADWQGNFTGARLKGARDAFHDWESVECLSVCHTPVGPTILNRCPRLKWVMVRGDATDGVDFGACRARGVGVVAAVPTQANCAQYMLKHMRKAPVLYYGCGRIGTLAKDLIGDFGLPEITSKTPRNIIEEALPKAKTICISTSWPKRQSKPPIFNTRFFSLVRDVKIVSIARPQTTDFRALLIAIQEGRVRQAVLDNIPKDWRALLLNTNKVRWTEHTAWLTGYTEPGEYIELIKQQATTIMLGKAENVLLEHKHVNTTRRIRRGFC